jgi:hypothetical protein
MRKYVCCIFIACFVSCGLSTFTSARALKPGHAAIGFCASGGGVFISDRDGPGFMDFAPYIHMGLFRNFEIGILVGPFTLSGHPNGSAYLKYQFMSRPYGSLVLSGGFTGPWTIDIHQGSTSASMFTGALLFGDPRYYGIKCAYECVYDGGWPYDEDHYYVIGPVLGVTSQGNFKVIGEAHILYGFTWEESDYYSGFGGTIGFGLQYDF